MLKIITVKALNKAYESWLLVNVRLQLFYLLDYVAPIEFVQIGNLKKYMMTFNVSLCIIISSVR